MCRNRYIQTKLIIIKNTINYKQVYLYRYHLLCKIYAQHIVYKNNTYLLLENELVE